jgi:hypothetical protein
MDLRLLSQERAALERLHNPYITTLHYAFQDDEFW